MPTYATEKGATVTTLEPGKRGGEATVYELQGQPGKVAKIYLSQRHAQERAEKLRAMLDNPASVQEAGHRYLTWPLELLYSGGNIVGYIMHRSQGTASIAQCSNLAHRKKSRAAWALSGEKGLYIVAYNLARAFKFCHRNHVCIGDVNETNILLTHVGLPTIIDTDSFQVTDPKNPSQVFLSPVIWPDFTPPERTPGNQVPIKPEQDNFGLAVLIYKLLHNGIHPFTGKDNHGVPHIADIPGRIKAHRFAHAANTANQRQISQKHLDRWAKLSEPVRNLFSRALDYQKHSVNRPTAAEWESCLAQEIDKWGLPPQLNPATNGISNEQIHDNESMTQCRCQCGCRQYHNAKYVVCFDCNDAKHQQQHPIPCRCSCGCRNPNLTKYATCTNCYNTMHK